MTMNRFFRLLWRFNALVVAGAGLVVIGGSMVVAVVVIQQERRETPIVKPNTPSPDSQKLAFGDFNPVVGVSTVIVPLEQDAESYGFGSSGGRRSVTRNLLFVDLTSGVQRWLIESGSVLILHYRQIERDVPRGKRAEAIAILAEIIDADTDGDGRLGNGDRVTVAFTRPDGTGYTEAIRDIDRLFGTRLVGGDLVIGYERKGDYNIATVRLSDFHVAVTHAIKLTRK